MGSFPEKMDIEFMAGFGLTTDTPYFALAMMSQIAWGPRGRQDPGEPHVGPMNLAISGVSIVSTTHKVTASYRE